MRKTLLPKTIIAFRYKFLFTCMLVFLFGKFPAQSYDFISYGVEDGLSQSEARAVFQDDRGYLWIGTAGGGVCSFDGLKFKEYGKKNGLAGQVITSIAEDSIGNMWFGTMDGGVSLFDGKSFSTIDSKKGLNENEVKCIVAKKDAVWIGVASGIFEMNQTTNVLRRVSGFTGLNSFCLDENGVAWVGTKFGLTRIANGKRDSIDLHLPLGSDPFVQCVYSDRHGLIYIGMNDRLLIYRPATGTFTTNPLTESLNGKQVRTIYTDREQDIWVGTFNNLVVKFSQSGNLVAYDQSNGLTAEAVYSIIEDDTRHMWFGTREQSLLKLRSEAFSYYGNLQGMGSGTVFRIFEDHAGSMWIGSNEEGLYVYDGKISRPVLNGGNKFKQPVAVSEDTQHKIWVGHFDGLTCLSNEKVVKQLLPGIRIRALFTDSKGNLWIGTWGKGVYVYTVANAGQAEALVNYSVESNSLPGNYIHCFCEDHSGNIWIGTGSGLVKFNDEKFTSYGIKEGLCNVYVGSLACDPSGNIWFHTDACVMRFDGANFSSYTDQNGLASNTIYLVAADSAGQIWVGTNKGIDRMKVDGLGRVLSVKNYSRNEGFRGIECNSRAVCLTKDNCLWFGTVKGVIKYNPSKDAVDEIVPLVHIIGINLFLEQTDWTYSGARELGWFHLPDKLELDYEHNHLTFLYEAIHLQSPNSTRYQFMLVGFDSTWQPVTNATQFTYTNLSPGKYYFKVKAENAEGKWNEVPAVSCQITILPPPPPFYETWWFIAIALITIVGILYYSVVGRTRRILAQKQLLEAEVRERTVEISKQNEEKTLMLKEIHHRVKNNLQVISSLLNLQADGISDKRVLALFEDCRNRVNSMALIHEKMYQSNNLVNIDIRNYIDELVRSLIDTYDSNKSIHLKTDIEDHPFRIDTIVPLGLILNEIISNALKYAFEGKSEGNLFVSLHKIGDHQFVLEVSDNGKGIPVTVDFENAGTLGMQLIHMLSGQISGKVSIEQNGGTKYRIEFVEEAKDRF